ncbi:hypothetical protein DL765_010836 [Monosporascus sp. GIB2]|nr:hypothetical protein DL765_010836 [Monosporascus sp. GIB2]
MSAIGLTKTQARMATWTSIAIVLGAAWISTPQSRCHDTFPGVGSDAELCAQIQANWARPELHDRTAHSPMAAFFANLSCDPFTPRHAQCVLGTYVPYAVNASDASDYREAIAFAKKYNIRLVIRNTGHDYMGRLTGPGALALWTHNIKDLSILDYKSTTYTGKAIKIGAGVQGSEAQEAANAEGLVVVEGDCPIVGIAGGYTQGGGTSPLGSKFGLAADQVLNMYDRYNMTANIIRQETVTKVLVPTLEDITPGSAAYVNEADLNQPNWQRVFYGTGYPMLLSIKQNKSHEMVFTTPWLKQLVSTASTDGAFDVVNFGVVLASDAVVQASGDEDAAMRKIPRRGGNKFVVGSRFNLLVFPRQPFWGGIVFYLASDIMSWNRGISVSQHAPSTPE